MDIAANYNPYAIRKSSETAIFKNIKIQEILSDKKVDSDLKLTIIFKDVDETMEKASNYLDEATQEQNYKLKNRLAQRGLGCITKVNSLLNNAKDIMQVDDSDLNNFENQITLGNLKAMMEDLSVKLTKQAYAVKLPKKTLNQMADYYKQKMEVLYDTRTTAKIEDNFEKGFIFSYRNYDENGFMEIDENNLPNDVPKLKIQVNLEDDPVLVKASDKLNEKLNNIDQENSTEVAKALLETESEFFKPDLATIPYDKNNVTYSSKNNNNIITQNNKEQYYSVFRQDRLPARILNIGEFASGSKGLPKATGTCLPQTIFTKAMAQLSGINTTWVSRKSHSFLEYNADDGKRFVIDPVNKLIFNLTDKEGVYLDIYNNTYMPLSKYKCNELFDDIHNLNGEGYSF
ncbi:MAG: hypothetical protein WCK67_12420 [bacterium]